MKAKHLSCEGALNQLSLELGRTLRIIARSLQRVLNSISRELKCNGWTNPTMCPRKRGRLPLAGGCRVPLAQQRAASLARTALCALITCSAAGVPEAIAIRSCGVQRATEYQRRRPPRTAGW